MPPPSQQIPVLPIIDADEAKSFSYARVILVEPLDTNDPLPVWLPTIFHFSSCCSSQRRPVAFGLNPRLRQFAQLFSKNAIELTHLSVSTNIVDTHLKKLRNCICFIDGANLLLTVSKCFLSELDKISRENDVIFVVCLDTGSLAALPDAHTIDMLRSIANVRLTFRRWVLAHQNQSLHSTWQLDSSTVSAKSARVTQKTQFVSSNMVTFEQIKQNIHEMDNNSTPTIVGSAKKEEMMAGLFKLPFSLSLTETEEASRRSVVLPHSNVIGRHEMPVAEVNVFEDDYTKMKNELDPDDDLDI